MVPQFFISTLDRDEWPASRPGRFIHGEKALHYPLHRSLGTVEKKKSLVPDRNRTPAVQPEAHRYTD
jgi:hypothetical protein